MTVDVHPTHPFAEASPLPYGLPPFADITPESFRAAFDDGMAAQLAEVDAIATDPESPSFENTLIALERSGQVLRRAQRVFGLLTSADLTDELETIETEYAPRFAAQADAILLDPRLFARLAADLGAARRARPGSRSRTGCWRSTTTTSSGPVPRSTSRAGPGWPR